MSPAPFVVQMPDNNSYRERGEGSHFAGFSAEHLTDGLLLLARNQVSISPPNLFGRVADPFVNQSLIDAHRCTVRNERVAEHVPAANVTPLRSVEGPLEKHVRFVLREGSGRGIELKVLHGWKQHELIFAFSTFQLSW